MRESLAHKRHLNELLDLVLARERARQGYSPNSKDSETLTDDYLLEEAVKTRAALATFYANAPPQVAKERESWTIMTQTEPVVVVDPDEHEALLKAHQIVRLQAQTRFLSVACQTTAPLNEPWKQRRVVTKIAPLSIDQKELIRCSVAVGTDPI